MRRAVLLLLATLLATTAGALVAVPGQAAPTGSLSVRESRVSVGDSVELDYQVSPAGPRNWVGIYADPGNGPVEQTYVGPSTTYRYIPAASGSVSFPTDGLEPGDYVAYALEDDGYRWLAEPVRFSVVDDEPLHFVTDTLPLRNAWAWTGYRASVAGLVAGDTAGLRFRKVRGPAWLRVTSAGDVRGTPLEGAAGRPATAVVEARNATGQRTTATLTVDVRRPRAALVPEAKVMSWNMWFGGTRVTDYREKQLRFILDSDVDVIGVQESFDTSARELGETLGWDYYQAGYDLGILSRYPIVKRSALPSESGLAAMSATIRLDPRRQTDVTVWNAHLGYTPYGPYDACFGQLPVDELLAKEADSGRTGQITDILDAMRPALRRTDATPVMLTGDFNAPSHLDWTRRTDRCGYDDGVLWPTSTLPADAGLVDTFRVAHRNPIAVPGETWSPVYRTFTGGYGYDERAGEPEPQDRIDYVLAKGDWRVRDSRAVVTGTPTPEPDHRDNEWTSDHAAVVTTFTVR